MHRLPTSFALSLWLGFHSVTGISELAQMFGAKMIGGIALETPAAAGLGSAFVSALTLGTAAVAAAALVCIHSTDRRRLRLGEMMAFGGVGVSSAMVLAAWLFGAPFASVFDRLDLAFWSVALSMLALAFDTCIYAPDDIEDELAFRKALLSIETSIPREPGNRTGNRSSRSGDL